MLSESSIITQLKQAFPSHIGDDAAVLPASSHNMVITKDILVEHKHFNTNYVDAASLAHKALHVNLSDLAAMGATPRYIMLGIAIPTRLSDYAKTFLTHFTTACKTANVVLIGGDTTASANDLFISVTALGEAQTSPLKYRNTAKPKQTICITGPLGLAHLGLCAFENNQPGFEAEKQALLKPRAKIQEGQWLAKQSAVTSLMDVSDGLYIDLKRLCEASRLGAELYLETLPQSPEFNAACLALKLDPATVLLTGGEDYGLLFTVEATEANHLADTFQKTFHYDFMQIGCTTSNHDITLLHHQKPTTLSLTPFNHFGEPL
ncbi:MAG TPA: thiamine-phosphate kinase [Gammaproteobacteria bacterium]|nr:thiamine-phosphate kinase [Gammaproteobacteria bacterium]